MDPWWSVIPWNFDRAEATQAATPSKHRRRRKPTKSVQKAARRRQRRMG
jgi:hypothetical protein